MTIEDAMLQFLDEEGRVAFSELLAASGLARSELLELVEYGVFQPSGSEIDTWVFSSGSIVHARRAARLRDDFGLDAPGMSLALALLERIDELEARLRELECQLPGR